MNGLSYFVRALASDAGSLAAALSPRRCAVCDAASQVTICCACAGGAERVDRRLELDGLTVVSAFAYQGVIAELIERAKYGYSALCAHALARWAAEVMPEELWSSQACLVPVISPRWRLTKRGFNLPTLLARQLAKRYDLPVRFGLKVPFTRVAQASLGRESRMRGEHLGFQSAPIRGVSSAILVDDVVTTGATLIAARSAMIAQGIAVPWAFTAARSV